jgi:hypothetical protein
MCAGSGDVCRKYFRVVFGNFYTFYVFRLKDLMNAVDQASVCNLTDAVET